ncbi:MAG: hypothetical protein JAY99_17375 [Candidatus Thiodiazotropha lotti]|nr:hypothetical protein [Candidatus Thiodiazotropha lotti]MCG8001291.1 hypothetical protein [Candidatus Thiodiazotropha lotti]MCW4182736.1 hypothetical protein [Candidatus Thiodiazotropha weberae]MCW4193065.1 hypothetical protein [Candidatus Thiodiazotropha weberae]
MIDVAWAQIGRIGVDLQLCMELMSLILTEIDQSKGLATDKLNFILWWDKRGGIGPIVVQDELLKVFFSD